MVSPTAASADLPSTASTVTASTAAPAASSTVRVSTAARAAAGSHEPASPRVQGFAPVRAVQVVAPLEHKAGCTCFMCQLRRGEKVQLKKVQRS